RQREAVVLRHLEELNNPDIASRLDISVEAVESLLSRGKRALKSALASRKGSLGYEND
ncbi:sigma factor-like helix-turn-helix DNA-binding protein, partial [Yoonia sp.]|uniref:sigma factor-like helix-turn-helix DNA-binding protein n=1 Tax=Yoonia sp. TaxID=2212373 RepID=UPI003266597C